MKNKKKNHFRKHFIFVFSLFHTRTFDRRKTKIAFVVDVSSIDVVACSHVMKSKSIEID